VILIDCDVEEPNSHLFLKPVIDVREDVHLLVPKVNLEKCQFCGECARICRFSAIVVIRKNVLTFHELCHGCGGCKKVCPEGAIDEVPNTIGFIERGWAVNVKFIHGRLNVGEAMSPPLIKAVKKGLMRNDLVIIDCPPGTSCPVIASVKGSDFCLLVTEPTPFGLNDLELAVEVVRKLGIPMGVLVNRSDIGDYSIRKYCHEEGIPLLMEIPEDRRIAEAYSRGEMIIQVLPEYRKHFQVLYRKIISLTKQPC
jgi:MinD superfamily P-loop ATPase